MSKLVYEFLKRQKHSNLLRTRGHKSCLSRGAHKGRSSLPRVQDTHVHLRKSEFHSRERFSPVMWSLSFFHSSPLDYCSHIPCSWLPSCLSTISLTESGSSNSICHPNFPFHPKYLNSIGQPNCRFCSTQVRNLHSDT